MWEFLSRTEKMNHLYKRFVKQVADYCSNNSEMPDCNKVMLVRGLTNLAKMENDALDKMDPYQRGSDDIIWESLMKDSYVTTSDLYSQQKEDYYVDPLDQSKNDNHLGSSSNQIDEISVLPFDNNPVIGPMMVRVLPDGRPVPGDEYKPLPKDEDKEDVMIGTQPIIPAISDVTNLSKPPVIVQPGSKDNSDKLY